MLLLNQVFISKSQTMKNKIDYEPLINLYTHVWEMKEIKSVTSIKNFFFKLLDDQWDIDTIQNKDIIFFQSLNRTDYNLFAQTIFNVIPTKNKYFSFLKKKKQDNLDIFNITVKEILNLFFQTKTIKDAKTRLFVIANILECLKLLQHMDKISPKCVVFHADMQPIENLIAQYFNLKNIPTITLQHGLYIDYLDTHNINEINYKSLVSKHLLAWGEETKNLIQRYHPDCDVRLVGNPTFIQKNITAQNFFVVVFEHEGNKLFNHILLKLGRKISTYFSLPIKIKLHPRNSLEEYNIQKEELIESDNVYNAKFAIGHTSTMMYELLRSGVPIFKLKSASPCNVTSSTLLFNNENNLILKIKNLHNIDYKDEGKFYIKYTEQEALNEYKAFFQEKLSKL